MSTSVTTAAEAARTEQDSGHRSLDELERDFRIDPCHFLRRACQVADYDTPSTAPQREAPRAPS
ncbi:MAG TPA: hypothetical protein VLI71_05635 [Gammaproteobacteria bacterium]|nr:hypothetical protein [Gammaproteobacteria bacterium]